MWSSIESADHRIAVFDPKGTAPRFGLLFLHDQNAQVAADWPDLSKLDATAWLCPHTDQSWCSAHICPSFDSNQSAESWIVNDVLPMFSERWRLTGNSIAIAGIGMGGQGALRLAFKYPERFPVVAAIDAAIDHYELYGQGTPLDEMYTSREHCRQDSATLHIHPAKQPRHIWFGCDPASRWFRGNDRLHEKLGALGIEHEFVDSAGSAADGFKLLGQFLMRSLMQAARSLA